MNKYSVLMCVYKNDVEDHLIASIDSLLNQNLFPDQIVIVIDGPIPINLDIIIQNYYIKFPKVFSIEKLSKNMGLGYSLNVGIQKCENEYIARMDADDICKNTRFEKQIAFLDKNPNIDIVGSYVSEFSGNIANSISIRKTPIKQSDIFNFSKRRSPFNHPSVVFRKSRVLAAGGYRDLRRNQDLELFGRMMYLNYTGENIPDTLLYYRVDEKNMFRRSSFQNTISYISIINNFRKNKHSNVFDVLVVSFVQIIMFILPMFLRKLIYKKVLRN